MELKVFKFSASGEYLGANAVIICKTKAKAIREMKRKLLKYNLSVDSWVLESAELFNPDKAPVVHFDNGDY